MDRLAAYKAHALYETLLCSAANVAVAGLRRGSSEAKLSLVPSVATQQAIKLTAKAAQYLVGGAITVSLSLSLMAPIHANYGYMPITDTCQLRIHANYGYMPITEFL